MSKKTECSKKKYKTPEKALFFSISGMRGTGRTRVFNRLKFLLPETFPRKSFVFLDDPFKELSHPLLWADNERMLHPVSRLFKCWAHLNDFSLKKLLPALNAYDVVVTDGYGLNAVLYATACDNCAKTDADVLAMHHRIVKARVCEQGIDPPEYFLTRADVGVVTEFLLDGACPGLTRDQCRDFILKEESIIDSYFDEDSGQKKPHILDAALSLEAMCENVAHVVHKRLAD